MKMILQFKQNLKEAGIPETKKLMKYLKDFSNMISDGQDFEYIESVDWKRQEGDEIIEVVSLHLKE